MPKYRRVKSRSWQVTLILTTFFFAVAGAAGIGWWYARESPPHQGPIVLVTVDGLSAELARTLQPASTGNAGAIVAPGGSGLGALAADSVIFERAYTHAPHVLPSHASMLSGRLPFEHGVRDDGGFILGAETRTLAEMLRNRGFNTGATVSSFELRRDSGVTRGFSFVARTPAGDTAADSPRATPAGHRDDATPGASDQNAAAMEVADATLAAAEEWTRSQQGQRYFLMLQVDAADADAAVTRISTILREQRLYDDATIILVGARGRADIRLDDDTLHVPLWFKQPQREGAGRRIAAPVQHIDLLPTILDLVRAPIPGDLRGRSLRSVLSDEDARLTPQPIYSESLAAAFRVGGHPAFALTLNDFRYLRTGSEQLTPLRTAVAEPISVGESATVEPDIAPLRATLARLLAGRTLPMAGEIIPRDRHPLARTGYLAGLVPASDDANLSNQQQDAILAAHQLAAVLIGEHRPAAALRALQSLAREYPTVAALYFQLGTVAGELGRTRDAIAAFRAASTLRPDAPEIPRALALVLARTGKIADAHTQAALAIELALPLGATALARSHEIAVRVALLNGDPDAARVHAEAVQAANPSIPMLLFVEGWTLNNEAAYSEALPVLQRATALLRQHDATLEGLYLALGEALMKVGRPQEAEAALREELREFPDSIAAYSGLALALGHANHDTAVEDVVARLLDEIPTPDGYAAAARVWTTLGQRARAEDVRSAAQARFRMDASLARAGRVRTQ